MAEEVYERLTGSKPRQTVALAFHTRSSLWLGSNHLLLVDTSGFTETYKRFYFRDIQAVTIRLTPRRTSWNWILGILVSAMAGSLVYALLAGNSALVWILGPLLILFALPLVINNTLGPTCAVKVRTAVQTEDLPSLNRLRKAKVILDRIRPMIAEAQGLLTPEDARERMRHLVTPPTQVPTAPLIGVIPEPGVPPKIQ